MPYGYVVAHVKVTDPEQYKQYVELSTAALKHHNVEVLARGGKVEVMEGEFNSRVVIFKFPSFEAAKAFPNSPEYSLARQSRAGAAIMNMVAVEGVA